MVSMVVGDEGKVSVGQLIVIQQRRRLAGGVGRKVWVDVDDLTGQLEDKAVLAQPPESGMAAPFVDRCNFGKKRLMRMCRRQNSEHGVSFKGSKVKSRSLQDDGLGGFLAANQ